MWDISQVLWVKNCIMQIKIWEDFFLCFYQHSYTQILQGCLWTCICHKYGFAFVVLQLRHDTDGFITTSYISLPSDYLTTRSISVWALFSHEPLPFAVLSLQHDLQEHFCCARAMTASLPQHCQQKSWMKPGAVWFPEEKRTLPEKKKKAEGKTRQRRLWALATITAGMLWPWRKGRWEKQMGPDAWMMPHKTMEDISFKIDKNSIQRQSNGKLLGAESLKYTVLIFHIYKQLCNVIKIGQSVAGIPSSITASRCVAI